MGLKKNYFMVAHAQGVDGNKPEHLVAAFKADGFSVSFKKYGAVPTLNDSPMKDEQGEPLKFEDVFNDWKKKNNFVSEGEAGAGSSKFESMNDVYKHMEDNKIDPLSMKGEKLLKDFKASQEELSK